MAEQSRSVTAVLRARDSGFTSTFQKASGLLSKFTSNSKGLKSSAGGVVSSIKSIAGAMGLVKVASMALSTVTSNLTSAMNRQDTLYLYNRNLQQAGYSAKEAADNQKVLGDAVLDTAYGLDSVANSTQSFVNSTGDLGKATQYSTRFMDLISRYGDGTNETYKRVMLQMNQMSSKGKANLGDIKSAVEANIPVWKLLSEQTGKSVEEIQDDISAGKMTAEEFFDALMAGSENAAGAAKDGANTWAGAIGIMKSRFALGVGDILNSVKSIATAITGDEFGIYKAITGLGSFVRGQFASVGEFMTKAFQVSYPYIQSTLDLLNKFKDTIATNITPYVQVLKDAFVRIGPPIVDAFQSIISSVTGSSKAFLTSKGNIETFTSVVEFVADKIVQFSNYVSDNSDKLVSLGGKALKAYAMLKVFSGLTPIISTIASFSSGIVGLISSLGGLNSVLGTKLLTNVSALGSKLSGLFSGGFSTARTQMLVFSDTFRSSMASLGNTGNYSAITRGFLSIKNAISTTYPNISNFGSKVKGLGSSIIHPIQSMNSLKASLIATSTAAGGSGTVISGVALKIKAAFSTMTTGAISAVKGLGTFLLANPIGIALALITAGIAGFVAAWRENFMNIQGFVKTSFGAIGNSITSMKSMFKEIGPALSAMGKAFKGLGVILAGTVLVAVAGVVDAFRALVFAGLSIIKTATAVGNAMTGLWKKIKGDDKGAEKAFDAMKSDLSDIKDGFDNLVDNSALKGVVESTKELGKETQVTATAMKIGMEEAGTGLDSYSSKLEETKQKLLEVFAAGEETGSTAGVEAYFQRTLDLVTSLKEQQLEAVEIYNKQIEAAEGKTEEQKQKIYADAASVYTESVKKNNDDLLTVYKEYSKQLGENKNVEGQELTEQQRSAMYAQTDLIRDQLQVQNQEFVDAGVNRLENGQRLTDTEQQQMLNSLQTLGQIQTEQTQINNGQITALKEQQNVAKDAAEKAAFQSEIDNLTAKNAEILASETAQGAQLMAILSQNGENNTAIVAEGLANMKNVTDEQLVGMVQSYADSGASTNAQMMLLAGVLQQRGVDASNGLVQGLSSNDPSMWASMSKDDIVSTINTLPPALFKDGQSSKDQLVSGLNSGTTDMNNVGKSLMESMNKGQTSQKSNTQKASKDNARAGADAAKKEESQYKAAGSTDGSGFVDGIINQKPNSANAGTSLATSARTAAGSIDFNGTGSNMAAGIASGISANQSAAVSAMTTLVNAVNEEAKKVAEIKSPSRLFKREVGRYIAQGVAVGIEEDTKMAVDSARNMINEVQSAVSSPSSKMNASLSLEAKGSYSIEEKLNEMIEAIRNLKLFLDTGALVGGIGDQTDGYLGSRAGYVGRYR